MDTLIRLERHPERAEFLTQTTAWQKENLLSLFGCPSSLQARCINPDHADAEASMVVYPNGAYCFGCKHHWWPDQFLLMLGDDDLEFERQYRGRETTAARVSLAQVQTFANWLYEGPYEDRLSWLLARGLRLDALMLNHIGHTGEAFSIPILDGNKLVAIRYRRDDLLAVERPKYWGTRGHNGPLLYRPVPIGAGQYSEGAVFLCEGELDALRLAQEGYAAVSMTNGAGTAVKAAPLLEQAETVYLVLDQDEAGRQATKKLKELLPRAKAVSWSPLRGKDVTEFLQCTPFSAFRARIALAE
jgi:hypothetical protein